MNPLRYPKMWFSCLVVAACATPVSATEFATALFNFLFSSPELQTITVTDVTPEGRKLRPPAPGHPVYYAAISGGFHDFGAAIAGDRMIARSEVNKTMIKVLAKQGYLPVGPNQKPDIIVGWTWGTMYIEDFLGPNGVHYRSGGDRNLVFAGGRKLGLSRSPRRISPNSPRCRA